MCAGDVMKRNGFLLFTYKHDLGQEIVNLNLAAAIEMSFLFLSRKEQKNPTLYFY